MLKQLGNLIPGPAVAEDETNLAQLASAGGYIVWQRDLHRLYGPVVRLWTSPSTLIVSIGSPEFVHATKHLADRPGVPLSFLEQIAGKHNLESAPASKERNASSKQFAKLLIGRNLFRIHYSTLNGYIDRLLDRWSLAGKRNEAVALSYHLRRLSLNMMGYILCSRDFESMGLLEPLVTSLEYAQAYQPEKGNSILFSEKMRFLKEITDQIMQRQVSFGSGGSYNDLLEMMLREGFSYQECRSNMILMLVSSMHTTPSAIAFTLYLLARHPEIADRVRTELDCVFGNNAILCYEDLGHLQYLTQVLKESLRYYPPTIFVRSVAQQFNLGGYMIPEGASLFYATWALHWNPVCWPDPEKFDPDRFLPEIKEHHPFAYVPFGVGERRCIGMDLALTEMRMILSLLLKRFTFDLVPGHQVVFTEKLGAFLCADQDIKAIPVIREPLRGASVND